MNKIKAFKAKVIEYFKNNDFAFLHPIFYSKNLTAKDPYEWRREKFRCQ